MASTSVLNEVAQYSVTRHGNLSEEWEIKSREAGDSHWIRFPFFGPCMLLDEQRQPMGKISSKKFFTWKMNIAMNRSDCHVCVVWRPTMSNFHLEGTTDIKGYETIDWKWKRKGWDSKFSLENKSDGRVIAVYCRDQFKYKKNGNIYIYETLPEDIKLLIVFSACYSLSHIQWEELGLGV